MILPRPCPERNETPCRGRGPVGLCLETPLNTDILISNQVRVSDKNGTQKNLTHSLCNCHAASRESFEA
ncbi:hypothetical protein TNCV_2438911 [Trichonephila clavipes]|nr:hypothetical protein TNCV_2438911 [Trichonephila clavipes]